MRVKRQKRHRKSVRFYTACFGFREPFKILCDGTFIHHLIAHELTPADEKLSQLLGGKVQLFTSGCVIGEVKSLGKNFEETLQAAQDLVIARCDHEIRVGAGKCVYSIIGENNTEHFFVATQDKEIRRKLREIPGVPVIYGLRNALFLEQPSIHQRNFVQSTEQKRSHVSELEYQKLQKIRLKDNMEDSTNLHDTHDDLNNKPEIAYSASKNTARMLGVADKTKFKRKKAKGPNPLSCKKKKESDNFTAAQSQNVETDGVAKKRKRTRKRKKASSDNNAGESGS